MATIAVVSAAQSSGRGPGSVSTKGPARAQSPANSIETNKKLVSDFYRLVYEPRNAELADQYIAANYIEHDPHWQDGRENFVKMLKSQPFDSYDVGSDLRNPPALIVAEKDLVTYVFRQIVPDPQDRTKSYEQYSFDTYRVKDGKLVEHWNGAGK